MPADQDVVMLRPLANSLPIGLVGLAIATVMLAGRQLHWLPAADSHQVALVLLIVAVPMQLLAAIVGFLARDAVAATGMSTLAVIWLTTGAITYLSAPSSRSPVLGMFLFVTAAALLISAVTAAAGKQLASAVLTVTAIRIATSGGYEFSGAAAWREATGWIGVALCVLALYAALAFELEDIRHHPVLPTFRRGSARQAMEGDTAPGPQTLRTEAGIRGQL